MNDFYLFKVFVNFKIRQSRTSIFINSIFITDKSMGEILYCSM